MHIESGTIRGIGGAYISATALPFRGSSTVEPEPLPVDPLLALLVIPTGSTLRILFGAQLDPEHAATTDRFQYQVTGPKGALSITSVTLHSDGRSVVLQLAAPFPVGEGTVKIAAGAARSWPGETLNHETVLPVLVPKPEEPPVPVPTELLPPWSFVVSTGETIALNVRPSQASFVVTNAALELDAGDSDVEIKIR